MTLAFFPGVHHPADAHHFNLCIVSLNVLKDRKSGFAVNNWVLDSGAFSQISNGRDHMPVEEYAAQIRRWSECGNLLAAVSQDYMCEPFILDITGLAVEDHQRMTCERYRDLMAEDTGGTYIMPVLQGFAPEEYVVHIRMYAEMGMPLPYSAWVGVGSVCRRNGSPRAVYAVLWAILRERPDLRLHGFGLKITALGWPSIVRMLHTCDSMAWSFGARKRNGGGNDYRDGLAYVGRVGALIDRAMIEEPAMQGVMDLTDHDGG